MKVIGGYSADDLIFFASQRVKVVVHDDYKIEYIPFLLTDEDKNRIFSEEKRKDELNKNAGKNIFKSMKAKFKEIFPRENFEVKHKLTKIQILYLIFEIIFLVVGIITKCKWYAIIPAILFFGYSVYNLVMVVKAFSVRDKLRKMHGAEHMTYNASLKGKVTKESILRSSQYCNHCGSVKPANQLFLELINLILSLCFGIWIPHALVLFITLNTYSSIPGNFISKYYQRYLTSMPDEKNVFMANICYEILKKTDYLMANDVTVTPRIFSIVIKKAAEEVLRDNDYCIKNPFV